MSTSRTQSVERAVETCSPADVTPVELDAAALSSTAPSYLRDLKAELSAEGYQPAALRASASFAEDCSIATQSEADRLRDVIRAAAFLGAGSVELTVEEVADDEKATTALSALAERAEREGVVLSVDGGVDVDIKTDVAG
ncbi:MAG: hypothetical protein ABEJ79_06840 [Halolamina sp.]